MSVKYCSHNHHSCCKVRKLYRRLLIGGAVLVGLVGFTVFLVWAILQPSRPRFILQDVTVYNLSVSAPPPQYMTLTATMQITVSGRNPNGRIGIYYLKLDAYAAYRNQPITLTTALPATYQGHRDVTVWSPLVYGDAVPVSPFLQQLLAQDLNAGAVLLSIKIDGRLKWKVGTWISGTYQLSVNCPAYIRFSDPTAKLVSSSSVLKFQLVQGCSVETPALA